MSIRAEDMFQINWVIFISPRISSGQLWSGIGHKRVSSSSTESSSCQPQRLSLQGWLMGFWGNSWLNVYLLIPAPPPQLNSQEDGENCWGSSIFTLHCVNLISSFLYNRICPVNEPDAKLSEDGDWLHICHPLSQHQSKQRDYKTHWWCFN